MNGSMLSKLIILVVFSLIARCGHSQQLPSELTFSYIKGSEFQLTAATIIATAYRRLGIKVHLQGLPSKRGLQQSNSGKLDGEIIRVPQINRTYQNLVKIPVAVYQMHGVAYTHNNPNHFTDIAKLFKYRVALQSGIYWQEEIAAKYQSRVTRVTTVEKQLKLLTMGRVDYILSQKSSAELVIDAKFAEQGIIEVKPELNEIELFHYLHKMHQSLLPLITKQLTKMRLNGEIQRIWEQRKCMKE